MCVRKSTLKSSLYRGMQRLGTPSLYIFTVAEISSQKPEIFNILCQYYTVLYYSY